MGHCGRRLISLLCQKDNGEARSNIRLSQKKRLGVNKPCSVTCDDDLSFPSSVEPHADTLDDDLSFLSSIDLLKMFPDIESSSCSSLTSEMGMSFFEDQDESSSSSTKNRDIFDFNPVISLGDAMDSGDGMLLDEVEWHSLDSSHSIHTAVCPQSTASIHCNETCSIDWEHIEETHNQYLARRYDRHHIERYLEYLCPVDTNESLDWWEAKFESSFPRLANFVESEETFKFDNTNDSQGVTETSTIPTFLKVPLLTETPIEEDDTQCQALPLCENNEIKSITSFAGENMPLIILEDIPLSIGISTLIHSDEDDSTIADSVLDGSLDGSLDENLINIKQINSYSTNQSPRGVGDFHQSKRSQQQESFESMSSSQLTSPTCTSSQVSYSSKNVLKIKSRRRLLESDYGSYLSTSSYRTDSDKVNKIKSRLRQIENDYNRTSTTLFEV